MVKSLKIDTSHDIFIIIERAILSLKSTRIEILEEWRLNSIYWEIVSDGMGYPIDDGICEDRDHNNVAHRTKWREPNSKNFATA